MYAASARFFTTLTESYTPITEVTLFRTDGRVETLDIIGGSVPVDRSQACRRTCTVTVPDPALIPRTAADKLSVYGAQLRIARGVQAGAYRELVPVGVFRLDGIEGDVDTGPVSLTGQSLECIIADDRFVTPYRATGTAIGAITALIVRSIPDAVVVSRVADAAIGPRTWDIEANPWEAVRELGAVVGAEVYCDAAGQFVIAALPDLLTTPPAWTVAAGERGVYVSAKRGMASRGVHNGVLARGESAETGTAPVAKLVVDSDPGSPTRWGGPFGRRPAFISSSALTTEAACEAAASLRLKQLMAPNATANLRSLANPALEAGDIIRVVYPSGPPDLVQAAAFGIDLGVNAGDFEVQAISAKEGT
ncbi:MULTISPECIES: DUF5047 domain-containing protein [Streptomyces]|uniref:DUF5047 domain-containing protein n=1 Tax=Streptomyces fradiae ATCC 10745 = DSM 40063 TaxID=1319510 RepID=A0A1Y2NXA2_STRFR|nr:MULTISPECIES: DUF5047 domain-containing protein [Streptomyces]KAF0649212.1 hypothetical protein K701_13980 [Streptomyces fradiae ATCC 10745 = DSM 40063]OSY51841.1 hypothetical protein BG846_02515 [Streptomyces fradiae ATCC 10745 = DSM 40063]QEV12011.1 DUF5047 domain-containing protein [Streptomyces fradiae ATCC 10745 = DSM 40063]